MTISIDATVGGASSNSYVTEVEQIAYMATRLNASAWTTVSGTTCTETEKSAMVEAARELDVLVWAGRRSTSTQVRQWPRWSVLNPDSPVGFLYDSATVPQRVKDAACELAFQFLNMGTTDLAALDTTLNIKSKKVDVLETVYAEPFTRAKGLKRFPRVWHLIQPLLDLSGAGAFSILRG